MMNLWWVTRPKRKLDSVPEVLTVFAGKALDEEWYGQRSSQISFEDELEKGNLKRKGARRDQGGSGGRTYAAWLESLGLIFRQEATGHIKLTLAGEAIISGEPPVDIIKNQVLKYQFPSAFSISRNVNVNPRFKIRPFQFLLKLLMDDDIGYLTQEEIGRIVIEEAENESEKCYQFVKNRILSYRNFGIQVLADDFHEKYASSRYSYNSENPYGYFDDIANTLINWMEYTQLAKRNDSKQLTVLEEKRSEAESILSQNLPFIDRPTQHEYFQRKYGIDPKHRKDTRNLEKTQTITARIVAEQKIRQRYIALSTKRLITGITADIVEEIAEYTGMKEQLVEETLVRLYPHGSIGGFMSSYFEMAFSGKDKAVDFEKATTEIFRDVFGYNAVHLGQTGSLSAPDVLLLSDNYGYQAVVDNKAYHAYSITGDHHNRMVHNYLQKISAYSPYSCDIGFFTYISGGFAPQIDAQIASEVQESGINGSAVTVSNFIKMIEQQDSGAKHYDHGTLRNIFGINRKVLLSDIV